LKSKLTVKEYTEALENNRLIGLKCLDCDTVTAPPRMTCSKCAGLNLEVVELSGNGKIVTFTSVRVPTQSRMGQQPYLVIMVELDEGPWLMANLSGSDAAAASMELIGKKVKMIAPLPSPERRPEGGLAPLFVLNL
jgi:uncharacterized OB-fold protein